MREIIGAENQRNIKLANNEYALTFADFVGNHRFIVLGFNEKVPVLPIKENTNLVVML